MRYVVKDYVLHMTMSHSLQGCTATVLLVWTNGDDNFFAQCANLGDSACVIKYVFIFRLSIRINHVELSSKEIVFEE